MTNKTESASTEKLGTGAKKKAKPRARRAPKTDRLLAELTRTLAELKALTGGGGAAIPPSAPTTGPVVALMADPRIVDTADMPEVPRLRYLMRQAAAGVELTREERLDADLGRELSHNKCHFCGAKSDPSLRTSVPWSGVSLCACLRQEKKRQPVATTPKTPSYVAEVDGWETARKEADGGISWLMPKLESGDVRPEQVLYRNTCRCRAVFPIYAGTVANVIKKWELTEYIESRKCLPCARAAETWRKQRQALSASVGVTPRKESREQTGIATLSEVVGAAAIFEQVRMQTTEPQAQSGAA